MFIRAATRAVPRATVRQARQAGVTRKYATTPAGGAPGAPGVGPTPTGGSGGGDNTLLYAGGAVALAGLGYYFFAGNSSAKGKAKEVEGRAKGLVNQAEGKAHELAGKAKGEYNEAVGEAKRALK